MTVTTTEEDDRPFVKIVFDGVIALGPGRPPDGVEEKGPFFAVLSRSTRRLSDRTRRLKKDKEVAAKFGAKTSAPDEEPYYVHMHVPTLFTVLKPAKGSRPPDQILELSPGTDRWYIWHPIRERLEFRIDGDGTPGVLEYPQGTPPVDFSGTRGHYLGKEELTFHPIDQVPDLREIWPDRSVLRDGLLSSDPEVDERVMTQVLVPGGTVVAAGVLEQGTPRKVVFEPVRKLDKHDAVPGTAVFVRGRQVEIASYSLDSGEALDSIVFDAPDGGEIWLSNGDPTDAEMDMKQISIQTLRRAVKEGNWKPSEAAERYFKDVLRQDIDPESVAKLAEFRFKHHHSLHTMLRSLHRTGDFDLDFELFYTLMKNDHLAQDGVGLPVPRHVDTQNQGGPDCYNCTCRTNDVLELKSNSDPARTTRRPGAGAAKSQIPPNAL